MTREEFEQYAKENGLVVWSKEMSEKAIKALEQEPILDKIRAEIAHLTIAEGGDDYVRKMAELFSLKMKVLQIFDKYKAESEVENGND